MSPTAFSLSVFRPLARRVGAHCGAAAAAMTMLVAAGPALAAEPQGGLPQITQTDTYAGQIFWTIVTFGILYLVMSRVVIPRIGNAMEERQDKIDDDLTRAGKLKSEAEQVIQEYEAALATARAAARETHREALEAWSKKADQREQAFAEKLGGQTNEAEARIATAKAEALANLKEVATEISAAATVKLVGSAPESAEVKKAVDASMTGSAGEGGQA